MTDYLLRARNFYARNTVERLVEEYATTLEALDKAEAERDALVKVVDWYADQMCEYGKDNPGCGHFHTDICAGCKARASLARHGLAVKEVG